ncbi:MAG: hypothetical protein LQ341_001454 [Variospora aurantia]|nr:MAG: hypothetical protein LQ341_001454 [Variospora aurantia]
MIVMLHLANDLTQNGTIRNGITVSADKYLTGRWGTIRASRGDKELINTSLMHKSAIKPSKSEKVPSPGMPPGLGRSYGPVNNSVPVPPYNSPAHQESRPNEEARNPAFARDTALPRGRIQGPPNVPIFAPTQAAGHILSPRSLSSAATARSPSGPNGALERRPSVTQAYHHNNRSHGGHQHVRNPSFVNSPTTSPLSPMAASAEYAGMTMVHHGAPEVRSRESPSTIVNGISPSSPSMASEKNNVNGTSTVPSQRRVDRAHTGKSRREQSHLRTQSRQHQSEQKTVGEYALHHLFTSFVGRADGKINRCVEDIGESEPRVEDVCGPGVDPEFDQLIAALGHIARPKPKPLIDTVMYWRKSKGEAATNAKTEFLQARSMYTTPRAPPRRINESPQALYPDQSYSVDDLGHPGSPLQLISTQAERRSAMSIYLLCRVLIEVYNQTTLVALTPSMAEKLEDIIFGQLKTTEPEQLHSTFRLANWKAFCQLLGVMSEMNLHSVSHRFTTDLRISQREASVKGALTRDAENKIVLMIWATRYLRIKVEPESTWKESCDLLHILGEFFVSSHGLEIKHAYCQVLEQLVLPIVAAGVPAQTHPGKWRDFLNMVNARLTSMLVKPRHWADAHRLSAVILCASPTETFAAQWLSMITPLQAKLKEKTTRSSALQSVCRLVWAYLEKVNEPAAATFRKLEDVMKIAFPSGKKSYYSIDTIFADPQVEILRIVGFRYPEFCFKSVIFPLMNADLFASGKDIKVDQIEPERVVIGIRASMAIITDRDMVDPRRPPFPTFSNLLVFEDSFQGAHVARQSSKDGPGLARPQHGRRDIARYLDDVSRDSYIRFCEILGKITLACDEVFGGQAVLDEKLGGLTPKTPIADTFSFSRRDDHATIADQKQGFYELFHTAIQALPHCLSQSTQLSPLIILLCNGTAHAHSNIASASARSLKTIACQSHAQAVTISFARFIFSFDARYSTLTDEGMLGPGHIEHTLQLYVDLLEIWIAEIKRKSKDAAIGLPDEAAFGNRGLPLDLAVVEDVESHGVFFLCSQSRRVRSFAVTLLRLVTEFDTALGQDHTRMIHVLKGDAQKIMDPDDEQLSVAERSRLLKGNGGRTQQNTLIELCSSEVSYDSTLWFKLFPNLIRRSFEICPNTVTLGREIVWTRLQQMHNVISNLATNARGPAQPVSEFNSARALNKLGTTSSEATIEQWKLYLIMACTTMTNAGAQTQSQLANTQHSRKASNKGQTLNQDKNSSARALFAFIIPLLSAVPPSIRDAIVIALGSINLNLYRTLLESLQYAVTTCKEEAKLRVGNHQRTGSSPRRNRRTDRLRTEVTHVYRLTARFLREHSVLKDDWIVNNLTAYTKDLRIFLSDTEIQNDWECQSLRRQYCGLLEELVSCLNRTSDPTIWMAFESRKSAFTLMEDWCGFSPNQGRILQREDNMKQSALEEHQDMGEKINAAMEIEKRDLRIAALSAMAALCAGPIQVSVQGGTLSFDVRRMLSWIEQIFGTTNDKLHLIGRRALHNLIVHNTDYPYLLEHTIEMCYASERSNALESYFEVATRILLEHPDYPLAFWRILGAVLFTLGHEKGAVRIKSAKLLRTLEQRQQKSSKLQDFDISISDRTTAVYKLAQFEISKRLAKQHSEYAFHIFSQFSMHFKNVSRDSQRNMVAAILPWIQAIELQVDPKGGPTAQSYMLLANLLEITTKASGGLHNEVQALWQALATGPHGGNVQLVLDFVISLCLDRREQSFVDYAKQIVVYLSSTPAGQKVVEFLLLQLTAKNMVPEKRDPVVLPPDSLGLAYVADLSQALPIGNKQAGFSLGQLSLIFLVDLMVAPMKLAKESIPLLLQVVLVLWDHYNALVQEQAREMLVHLIHELVITKIDDDATTPKKQSIEAFAESIRHHERNVVWSYEECNGSTEDGDDNRVPLGMAHVTSRLLDLFALAYPQLHEQWPKITLSWATSCPVRHIACRSFQIFRCTLSSLDQPMLADMLARLSNTIADEETDLQTFSMEILRTLKAIIGALEPTDLLQYRQLFWATYACLHTVNEQEFAEALGMLDRLLDKINFSDPAVLKLLREARPPEQTLEQLESGLLSEQPKPLPRWVDQSHGLASLVHKGFKSEASLEKSLGVFDRLVQLPDSELVGDSTRLLFGLLAHLPGFLHCFDTGFGETACVKPAQILAAVAEDQEHHEISMVLNAFANQRYTTAAEFNAQALSTVRQTFFPAWEAKSLEFLIGLLTNRSHWYRTKTLHVLCALLPEIKTAHPDIAGRGPDFISPLLRLLQTQYCPQALEAMDHFGALAVTKYDKDHMRMSMASSGSSKIRKEYHGTVSIYGIPEDNGWSVPKPMIWSAITRANMQAILCTCAAPNAVDAVATPEVEFDSQEYHQDSYFPVERNDTLHSEDVSAEVAGEGDMNDLVSKLDLLDDFFEGTLTSHRSRGRPYSGATITAYTAEADSGADLYDQLTAPILSKSLARTASVSSLHNGFSDTRGPAQREAKIKNAAAANHQIGPSASSSVAPARPPLHSRSVTSPASNLLKLSNLDRFSDEDSEGTFSEDERSTGYSGSKAIAASRGAQPGMRKIVTGAEKEWPLKGKLRAQSRSKGRSPDSPDVPPVPEAYLQQSVRSAEP